MHKWENWKKTKAMFWKKTSTNYDKWDNFTDSEDEFAAIEKNAEPIVPKNDPNFRALEKDIDERHAKLLKDLKKANELKELGNKDLQKGYLG
jgi:hypothetical protein